jgi:uncharacterized OB-fold protein
MSLIEFTENHVDLSTDMGYQFDFKCDRCGNGYKSAFKPSATGMAGGLLRAAGNMFGGLLGSAGRAAYDVQRAVGGSAHDAALREAVRDAKLVFKQCKRCGKWVCPEVCWNPKHGQCKACSPDLEQELSAAQAGTAVEQMQVKVKTADFTKDLNVSRVAKMECPKCGAETRGAKFCPQCGVPVSPKVECSTCGTLSDEGVKFCPECGNPLQSATKCGACGGEHEPGAKFCPSCGAKL